MLELTVCIGSSCRLKGSYNVIQTFQQMIEEKTLHERISFKSSFCMRQCRHHGAAVTVNGKQRQATAEGARKFFNTQVTGLA